MNLFALCGFAVASAFVVSIIKQIRPETASIASAAASVAIFFLVLQSVSPFVDFIKSTASASGAEGYFAIMLKALAIALCCKISGDICRDCGENSLASRVELAGKAGIVLISLPIVKELFEIAKDMLG